MNYEEAIQSEIEKRKTNAIIKEVEAMTDVQLYSEAERIKNSKPKRTQWGEGDPGLRCTMGGDMGRKEGETFLDWLRFK